MRRAIGSLMIVVFGAGALCAEEPVGTLMFHGGGTVSTAVRDRFFEYAGGKDARIIVIPTADTDTPEDDGRLDSWRRREPKSVELLHTASRTTAESKKFAKPLKSATGVWISGGYQTQLARIYRGTPVEKELQALLSRGGVIGGTSAGAAIQSRVMLVRDDIWEGFDLAPKIIVDQHFTERSRQPRLWRAVSANHDCIGVGVDEDTCAILRGDELTVMGDSTVSLFIHPRGGKQLERALKDGERVNLTSVRKRLAE